MNLIEGLKKEIARNEELLDGYKAIGPAGVLGGMAIQSDLNMAKRALETQDIVAMVRICKTLQGNK